MSDPLGEQTITVIEQVRGAHGDYTDGARTAWEGCSVQPMPAEEQARYGLVVTRRWRLFAPAGFTARAQDECEVVPGPVSDTDPAVPLRLGFHGPPETWPDEHGSAHHVEAVLQLVEGSS